MNLSQALVRNLFDYHDGQLVRKVSMGRGKAGDVAGSIGSNRYLQLQINKRKYYVHRIVFLWHHGYLPELLDHIDGNPLNNRIENLRLATPAENIWNARTPKTNTSGAKGASWHKKSSKWQVRICINSKEKHIGLFEDFELAELVAIMAREKYHGDFAKHF